MLRKLIILSAAGLAMSGGLIAAANSVGSVTTVEGEVYVVRGSETIQLSSGDEILDGDRVFTRSNGTADISSGGCSQSLGNASSIVVDANFCSKTPVQLAQNDVVEGIEIAGGGGVGAAPIIGGLAVAGAAAAAGAGGDDDGAPASP